MGTEDHLHIRGEYVLGFVALKDRLGSSPHTWRIPNRTPKIPLALRIISTYVENTLKGSTRLTQKQDHLHIRGEYKTT